jgi:gliding motility-associated-like protein
MIIKRTFFSLIYFLAYISGFAQYSVEGNLYTYSVDANTGIKGVYIANGLSNISISYTADNGKTVRWLSYKRSLADLTPVASSQVSEVNNGSTSTYTIATTEDATAYLAEEDGALKPALWIVDYSQHIPQMNSITATAADECSDKRVMIAIDKSDKITYYSNSGADYDIKMQYKLQYSKQEWNNASNSFVTSAVTTNWQTVGSTLAVESPLIDTKFTLIGDKIADHFGIAKSISSDTYQEKVTEAHIVTTQTASNADNEVSSDQTDGLGGSAPAEISFTGNGNEPVANFYSWTIFNKADLKNWIARYNDKNISYTFSNAGNYIVYLAITNQSGSCTDTAHVEFSISESFLDLPNYFTPNASPGENDEYKVAYKSLISFKATIFNRWGNKLYEWSDPAKGWDGKYNGKYVTPGVYFVVVEAKGSDGVNYKRARDINILTTP